MVEQGFKHGDVVALYMWNRPEYVCTWLGCAKVRQEWFCIFILSYFFVELLFHHFIQTVKMMIVILLMP